MMPLAWIRRHSVMFFFLIAYALSWSVWIPMAATGARVLQGSGWPTHVPGLLGPLVAAFAMQLVLAGRAGALDLLQRMARWRVALKWYLVAVSPLALFGVASVFVALSGKGGPDISGLGSFSGLPFVSALVMGVLLILAATGEETGWRGFAAQHMLEKRSLLATSVVIGLLWAAWHAPLFFLIENYRALGPLFVPGFVIGIVSGSIMLTWLYRASGGSVLIAAIWHGTFNLVSGTAAAHGALAAVVSMAVMIGAALVIWSELKPRPSRRESPFPVG